MSFTIPDDSPWKAAAVRVGAELRKAMETRSVGWRQLNAAVGKDVHSMIDRYKNGRNLPRLGQASLLAEALAWPQILDLVREARTFVCPIDGRTFTCDTGHRAKFCSTRCRNVEGVRRARMNTYTQQERDGYARDDPERVLVARLKQELQRVRGTTESLRRMEVRDAIKQWEQTGPQGLHRRTRNHLNEHLTAVEAMCHACEPEGICRTAECPLRSVSPLRLIPMTEVGLAAAKDPRSGWADPTIAAARRGAQSTKLKEMYAAEPARRTAMAERSRAWWAALTPEQRVEHGRKIAARRVGKPSIRDCGCPNRKHLDDCPTRLAEAV